jgi:SAM-dependent methyltransferase
MRAVSLVHGAIVVPRRAAVLARLIAPLLPPHASVLDLGAGDAFLASFGHDHRPDVLITSADVVRREKTFAPVLHYDGIRAPFADNAFDAVVLVDVLHHADDPKALFAEAVRLARKRIVVKDHICENQFDKLLLQFMDRVSNARFGVPLPYNYLARREWRELFSSAGTTASWSESLGLYPRPAALLFERSLHLLAAIDVSGGGKRR